VNLGVVAEEVFVRDRAVAVVVEEEDAGVEVAEEEIGVEWRRWRRRRPT
jgi:hypothetical protein